MQILSVTLRDFKIHRDRQFTFQPGVNAICGENGAGKTSILEALAWALFDYDSGYKKDQLRHQDSKSAEVTVEIISAQDGRTYRIQRETNKSRSDRYIIFDPQLNVQIDDINKIEDAQRWLCEHLGLPPGTQLSKLFGDVIGIPQGTFTLDFLKSATERRKVFDPILKVAEYKEAFKASSDLEKYAAVQTQTVEQQIANVSDRLEDWTQLKEQHQQQTELLTSSQSHLSTLKAEVEALAQQRSQLKAVADQITSLTQQVQTITTQVTAKQAAVQSAANSTQRAVEAQTACDAHKPAHKAYLAAEAGLKELAQQRQQRDRLLRDQSTQQQQLSQLQVRQASITTQLNQLEVAKEKLEALKPQVVQQMKLEAQQQEQQKLVQDFKTNQAELGRLQDQQKQQQSQIPALTQETERLEGLAAAIAQIPQLEAQLQQLQGQLGQVSAAQQFSQTLSGLVDSSKKNQQTHRRQVTQTVKAIKAIDEAPADLQKVLDKASKTLEAGADLHKADLKELQETLTELESQSDAVQLQQQLQDLQKQLRSSQRSNLEYETLPQKQQQLTQLQQESEALDQHLAKLTADLTDSDNLEQELQAIIEQLQALDNPRTQSQMLNQQLAAAENLQQQQQSLTEQQTGFEQAIATFTQQLQTFVDLEQQLQAQETAKQANALGYRTYLQYQKEAEALGDRQKHQQKLATELEQLQSQQLTAQQTLTQASANYDPATFTQLEANYGEAKQQQDQLAGALPGLQQELERLVKALEQRQVWAKQRAELQMQLGEKQRLHQFISDARRIYNQSGPRITQFYLNEIVREGDRLFRELMNRQNVALNWTEDYEIQIQEGSTWRGFKTLSGGEQMAAALAIRLALLKVLAELDVAFFDEPTTNMDRPRRQQLAESLSGLKSFRQLFVISHDDTFEAITDSIIRVEREAA